MDIYTVFAMAMSLLGGLAIGVGCVMIYDARAGRAQSEANIAHWCGDILDQAAKHNALHSKVEQALAQRIRDLETFRVNHAHRLNECEDLIELLNQEDPFEFAQRKTQELGAGELTIYDRTDAIEERNAAAERDLVREMRAARSDVDRSRIEFGCEADADEALRSSSAQQTIEKRFLQGL